MTVNVINEKCPKMNINLSKSWTQLYLPILNLNCFCLSIFHSSQSLQRLISQQLVDLQHSSLSAILFHETRLTGEERHPTLLRLSAKKYHIYLCHVEIKNICFTDSDLIWCNVWGYRHIYHLTTFFYPIFFMLSILMKWFKSCCIP